MDIEVKTSCWKRYEGIYYFYPMDIILNLIDYSYSQMVKGKGKCVKTTININNIRKSSKCILMTSNSLFSNNYFGVSYEPLGISLSPAFDYHVNAGLFFKSFFYIAVVYL